MPMCQVQDFVPGVTVADVQKRLVQQLVSGLGYADVDYREGW
jgi:lipoyl(octanoyl) transferase